MAGEGVTFFPPLSKKKSFVQKCRCVCMCGEEVLHIKQEVATLYQTIGSSERKIFFQCVCVHMCVHVCARLTWLAPPLFHRRKNPLGSTSSFTRVGEPLLGS